MDQTIAQINLWLDGHMQNPYTRLAIIVGLAIVTALTLRIFLLPLLQRLTRKSSTDIDDKAVSLLVLALTRTVVLQGIHIATLDFIPNERIDTVVTSITTTLVILIWVRFFSVTGAMVFKRLSKNVEKYKWIQPQTLPLVQFAYKVIVFGVMTYMIMSAWNINLTSWLASAGVLGIAVGFAAKDTLANFISGVFILVDAPYKVGQYIIIDGESRGVVTEIGMRSTRLLTRDNVEVTVPNAVIGNAKIVNESSGPSPRMRVRVNTSVAYGSDVDRVKEILLECVREVSHTSDEQSPVVRFITMGESSLDFQILVWVKHPVFRGRVRDEINTRVYKALAVEGLEIPFPQRDLHIKSWPSPPQV
ncbi:MAG: mechanosensitive ion channel domain-containing protein [Candidatus Krumholzibacteriota bacterium]